MIAVGGAYGQSGLLNISVSATTLLLGLLGLRGAEGRLTKSLVLIISPEDGVVGEGYHPEPRSLRDPLHLCPGAANLLQM